MNFTRFEAWIVSVIFRISYSNYSPSNRIFFAFRVAFLLVPVAGTAWSPLSSSRTFLFLPNPGSANTAAPACFVALTGTCFAAPLSAGWRLQKMLFANLRLYMKAILHFGSQLGNCQKASNCKKTERQKLRICSHYADLSICHWIMWLAAVISEIEAK